MSRDATSPDADDKTASSVPPRADPEERLRRPEPELRLGFGRLWIVFAIVTVAGAALLLRPEGLWQGIGVFLLLSPVIAFSLLMLAFYVKSRMTAK